MHRADDTSFRKPLGLLISHTVALTLATGATAWAQIDDDPNRHEIAFEYARPDAVPDFGGFRHAFFISEHAPVNDRLSVNSELSLVVTQTGDESSDTRFGSIYVGGEFDDEPIIVQVGVRIPLESNPLEHGYLADPGVDDRRLDAFRPEVGSFVLDVSRSTSQDRRLVFVGGLGAALLFGDLYEFEDRIWLSTDVEVVLRGTFATAEAGLSAAIPASTSDEGHSNDNWRFQPNASVRLNGGMVYPGIFLRHPGAPSVSAWVIGADVHIVFL